MKEPVPTLSYNLTPAVQIQTVVTSQGASTNNVATISIINAGTVMWTQVLVQASNVGVTPEIKIGSGSAQVVIYAGSSFTLTVPTSLQSGNIFANLTYDNGDNKGIQLQNLLYSWTLTDK